jgi:alkaline phosphatase D
LDQLFAFGLIDSTGANGVLLLSGNVHFNEISKYEGGRYPLYDFTASSMTHVNPDYANVANKHRVAGPYIEHNVGLIDIDWKGDPEPFIRLRALGIDGHSGLNYGISLGGLK